MAKSYTRVELYELVWSEPMRLLAKKFDLSDVGLAKACRAANVPVPPRGYWNKKSAGHKVQRLPLPPRDPGQSDRISFGRDYSYPRKRYNEDSPEPPAPVFEESIESVRARVEKAVRKVTPSRTFDLAHPAIAGLLKRDDRRREKYRETGWSWYAPVFEQPLHRRRLLILNSLFLALAAQRCSASARGDTGNEISITIGDTGFNIELEPVTGKSSAVATRTGSVQKEPLRLSCWTGRYDRRQLKVFAEDQPGQPLERQLRQATIELIVYGEVLHRERCNEMHQLQLQTRQQDIAEAKKRKEEAIRREIERKAALAKARVDTLLAEAAALRRARDIRAYVADVLKACAERTPEITATDLAAWEQWALQQADRIDPLVSGKFLVNFTRLRDDTAAPPASKQDGAEHHDDGDGHEHGRTR